MRKPQTRRDFLRDTLCSAAGIWLGMSTGMRRHASPGERLNLGIIGTANRAQANIAGVSEHNIAAICDIDDHYLSAAALKFPRAKRYTDFRRLLEQRDLDAVVISTPDHTHAAAALGALDCGLHVYCEKPLAHTVAEARAIAERAARHKLATQMGIQVHASRNYRRVVELIQANAIGPVRECHVWCEKSWSADAQPTDSPPVPRSLHWDLWLGPVAECAYSPRYLPCEWRRWWNFGTGTLGDMGCHYLDLAHWALQLRHPATIEAEGPPVHPAAAPAWLIVRYDYPARDNSPRAEVTWYDGGKRPRLVHEGKVPAWRNGVLFVGDHGLLLADYEHHQFLPENKFAGFIPPEPTIPDSVGHYREWLNACKTGAPTTCNFDYSGALTEAVLLGAVAYRTGARLEWDPANLRVTNCAPAEGYIRTASRPGWNV